MQFDTDLFLMINQDMANIVFDWLMPHLRNPYTWAPLYLFILVFSIRTYKKRGVIMMVFLLLSFGAADFLSASVIKPAVKRIRPCNELTLQGEMVSRVRCGSGYSFPSSHASNHFAMALFLILVYRKRWNAILWFALFWAFAIGFAQIYVGVHYPVDVLAGAVFGSLIGYSLARLFLYIQPEGSQQITKP
ncbi:phosphatase PAP2 family protein [Olivibacter sp. XZL3]|uniref:phosphatase PAP2 family protein n=1 Tax=Olivibacter sp. XZL3 TaxID=1735116 RepID=UPI00351A8A9F